MIETGDVRTAALDNLVTAVCFTNSPLSRHGNEVRRTICVLMILLMMMELLDKRSGCQLNFWAGASSWRRAEVFPLRRMTLGLSAEGHLDKHSP
jgi:hypothetical protein